MLAVVNQPRTQSTSPASFRVEGENIPKFVVMFLEAAFPDSVKVENDDDETIPVEETDWYKEISARMTPGDTVKASRGLRGWTQKVLAQRLGVSVQNVSEMERGVRSVSRKMATKLGEIFGMDPADFFEFSAGKKAKVTKKKSKA